MNNSQMPIFGTVESVPSYPSTRELALHDRSFIYQLCCDMQPRISEMTFAGLYLFRHAHNYNITKIDDSIVIFGVGYDGVQYVLPPLGGKVSQNLKTVLNDGYALYGADDRYIADYLGSFIIRTGELRDSFDYVYLKEDLAQLPGSRYHKKKNRINYFTGRHDYSVSLFDASHRDGCLALLDRWNTYRENETHPSLIHEVAAAREGVTLSTELGLEGVVITIGNTIAAFALGERLNNETAVCHFEKADPFTEGLYQLINKEFARLLFQDCTYLNREQDLGNAGLRNAKLSYHPVYLAKKYLVTIQ